LAFTHFTRLAQAVPGSLGAAYEAKLQQALGKPAAEVARWIRNPELYRPGTPMPTFESVLDENAALELANWLL